jgi:uncharacterized membrane protein YraQ (UPF0718 family)
MKKFVEKKHFPGYLFLVLVLIIYLVLLFQHPSLVWVSLRSSCSIIIKASTTFIFIFISLFLSHLLLRPEFLLKRINGKAKIAEWAIAIVSGLLFMGAMFMSFPLMARLKEKKVGLGFIAIFLACKPINLALIPTFMLFFGVKYVLIITILMIVFAFIQGVIFDYFEKKNIC